jgi:site-specific recombinase XerD
MVPMSRAFSCSGSLPADLTRSPALLRLAALKKLRLRGGHDLVLVAELMGHRRLETTRGYALPSAADRERAINSLPTDR